MTVRWGKRLIGTPGSPIELPHLPEDAPTHEIVRVALTAVTQAMFGM
jgi:hypothetical protein